MTQLDAAHVEMVAAPDDDGARLRFWGAVAESELFLMLAEEMADDRITPAEAEAEGMRFVLAFDREERLAEFAGCAVPYAALSGRRLVRLLAGRGLGVALNPDVAPSATMLGAAAVEWLAGLVPDVPLAVEARIEEVFAPSGLSETVVMALGRRLGLAGDMARTAWLVDARCSGGVRRHVLAVVGVAPGAEAALATAVAEALRFSGAEAGMIDVTYLADHSPVLAQFAKVGLRFDLPRHATSPMPGPPGMERERPPKLK